MPWSTDITACASIRASHWALVAGETAVTSVESRYLSASLEADGEVVVSVVARPGGGHVSGFLSFLCRPFAPARGARQIDVRLLSS